MGREWKNREKVLDRNAKQEGQFSGQGRKNPETGEEERDRRENLSVRREGLSSASWKTDPL